MGTRRRTAPAQRTQRAARQQHHQRRRRWIGWLAATALVLAAVALGAAILAGGEDTQQAGPSFTHVHGLGLDPADGSLYIATHTGLFRAAQGQRKARRVGDSDQDVMGFSVLGPNTFLGSGHPGAMQSGPPNLGLIRSDDAGRSWDSIALMGEADFHVLRSQASQVYGHNATSGSLMVSQDRGRSWDERDPPGAMLDLAIDPTNPARVVATTEQGLVTSTNQGRSWRTLRKGALGLLAWPSAGRLYFLDGNGQVALSQDSGRSWKPIGSIEAQPAAFAAAGDDLYAALPDGTVKRSTDHGRTWSVRAGL